MIAPRRWLAAATLVALVVTGATLTLARRAWWAPGAVAHRGIHPGLERIDGVEWRRFRAYGKLEVPDPGWRPLRVSMELAPAPSAPGSVSRVDVSIADRLVHIASVGPGATSVNLLVEGAAAGDGVLSLQLQSEVFDPEERGVAIASVSVRPQINARSLVTFGWTGAALGAALWWLWWWPSPRRSDRCPAGIEALPEASPAGSASQAPRWHAWAAAAASLGLFLVWAVLKPPMQAPDEQMHFVRALASPQVPWLSGAPEVPVSERHWNPLAGMPDTLRALPFHPQIQLTQPQIAALGQESWHDLSGHRRVFTQAWTYPPGFYHAAFAAGQGLTWLVGATPYQSSYLYRAAVAALAAACWTWVFVALRRTPLSSHQRWFVLAACLASPMVAFLSSSVNPDALHVPLVVLGFVYGYQAVVQGREHRQLQVVLLLAALTKPSALILMAAVMGTAVLLVLSRRLNWRHAADGLRPVAGAGILTYLTLTMWAPLVLYGTPRNLSLAEYWSELNRYGWQRWVWFWGKPGWLDYQGPEWLYVGLYWLLAVNLALAAPALVRGWRRAEFGAFAVVVSLLFIVGTLAGEYVYVSKAGLTFQGRYVLPALLGVSTVLLASWRPARWAFLAVLLALHLSLVQRSVTRYYGDTRTWLSALAWLSASDGLAERPGADTDGAPPE